jgi:preprotein translocase SecE subunit
MTVKGKNVIGFFRETLDEAKKLTVPSKKETYVTTLTILLSIIIASLAISFADFLILKIITIIFGL